VTILVLGGTSFLGRAIVTEALAANYSVTIFQRGQTNPDLFPEVPRINGDRDGGLSQIDGRQWDQVVDVSGYVPRIVQHSAECLRNSNHYTFISTISVYRDFAYPGLNEESDVWEALPAASETIDAESYGPLKAACEQVVEKLWKGRNLIVRPGIIVGPHDPTDRFTYWPARWANGGSVVLPDRKTQPVQWIDVRDLAHWIVQLLPQEVCGVFNCVGPELAFDLGKFMEVCESATRSQGNANWIPTDFLESKGVEPWQDLPLVLPFHGERDGVFQVDGIKARSHGLRLRPLEETVRDTLRWYDKRETKTLKVGWDMEREARILAAWKNEAKDGG